MTFYNNTAVIVKFLFSKYDSKENNFSKPEEEKRDASVGII